MESYINLTDFRQRNGITQTELARILKTSTPFISMIESGSSRMPVKKIKLLLNACKENCWFTDELVPAGHRLEHLLINIEASEDVTDEEKKLFKQRFESSIPKGIQDSITFGQQGIDSVLADKIISICPPPFDKIRKEWLMDGDGYMFSTADKTGFTVVYSEEEIIARLKRIEEKQEKLEHELLRITEILLNQLQ